MLETYLVSLIPAISSVIGIIASVIVAVKKIKKSNSETEITIKNIHAEILKEKEEKATIVKENVELKRMLNKISAKLDHVHFVENKEK